MVWSTWLTNKSHRKMTVRERLTVGTHHAHGHMHSTTSSHARKCVLITGKKISLLTARTQQLYLRTQGSASLSSLTAGTHPVEESVPLSVLSEHVRTYWSIGRFATMNCGRVSSGTCHSIAPHIAVQAVPSKSCTRTYSHTRKHVHG